MPEAVNFLRACAHLLSAMSLYPHGHSSRERALDSAYQALLDLLAVNPNPEYSFLGEEVIFGDAPLREMQNWEWSERLAGIGIERMEFDTTVTREDLDDFLSELVRRVAAQGIDSAEARQTRSTGIRYGVIGVGEEGDRGDDVTIATLELNLGDEARTVRWLQDELRQGNKLQLGEAEAVVRSLSVAMHAGQDIMLPLLRMREYDEYTTTHSLNVSVLAMALAEWLELGARDVRSLGQAGLLHDLGKVKIPSDLLNKPGKLSESERAVIKQHPVEGARLILASEEHLDLAAIVAYEHHIMINGGGYPNFRYPRDCHHASKIVHVCDVYDALRTKRPYRDAWRAEKVLAYIEERSGVEFDGAIAHQFTKMISNWEPRVASIDDEDEPEGAAPTPPAPAPTDSAQAPL